MSSDPTSAPPTHVRLPTVAAVPPAMPNQPAEARPAHRFTRTIALVIAGLLLLVGGLTAANTVQGPRVVRAELDLAATVEGGGQVLSLQLDQAVDPAGRARVTVRPVVPVEVGLEGAVLTLRFIQALQQGTRYEVTAPLQSRVTGATSTLTHSFSTPRPRLYLLQQAAGGLGSGADDIITVTGGDEPEQVFSSPGVREFAVAEPHVAVVTEDAEGLNAVTVAATGGGPAPQVVLERAHVSQLRSSGPAGVLGFVVTTQPAGSELDPVELRLFRPGSDAAPTPVVGRDGKPFQVLDWRFVPGTTSVVVQDTELNLFLVDPLGGAKTQPLGTHVRLHGFGRGTALVVEDKEGEFTRLDLAAGRTTAVPRVDTGSALISELLPLREPGRYVAVLLDASSGTEVSSSVATVEQGRVTPVYAAERGSSINQLCLSPNQEYVALTLFSQPDPSTAADPAGSLRTRVVELGTGRVELDRRGSAADWCRR